MINKESSSYKKNLINYERKNMQWFYYVPLFLIICFVPLIMKSRVVFLSEVQSEFWTGSSENIDFFSYAKMQWLLALTSLYMFFFMFLYVDKKRNLKKEPIYYSLLGLYAIFIIISTILSTNIETALFGFADMHQGVWVLLSYILLTFLTINYINNEKDILVVLKAFLILAIIEGIIGFGQFVGLDIFKSDFMKPFILSNKISYTDFKFTFSKYTIYGTLFNTNFIGSFSAIIIPIIIAAYITSIKRTYKILSAVGIFFSICLFIGCNSRAGYLSIFTVLLMTVFLLHKQIKKNYRLPLALVLSVIVILSSFNIMSSGKILNQFVRLNPVVEINKISENNSKTSVKFEEILLNGKEFTIKTNYEELTLSVENDVIAAYDEAKKVINIEQREDNNFVFISDNYSNYSFNLDMTDGFVIILNAYGKKIPLAFTEYGFKLIGVGNRLSENITAKTFKLLDGYEKFASNRGYIWSRSIMQLPNTILYGYGPDNYVFNFPHDDYIAKLNAGYASTAIIDKPHNMYLQIALNTGMLSLLVVIGICLYYIIDCFKIYYNATYDSLYKCVGYASFMSVCGYLVAGIFNDQIISVAPLFWVVLGLGISINNRIKIKNKKKE